MNRPSASTDNSPVEVRLALLEQAQTVAAEANRAQYDAISSLTQLVTQAKEVLRGLDAHVADLRSQQRETDKEGLPRRMQVAEKDIDDLHELMSRIDSTLTGLATRMQDIATRGDLSVALQQHEKDSHAEWPTAPSRKAQVVTHAGSAGAGAAIIKLIEWVISSSF